MVNLKKTNNGFQLFRTCRLPIPGRCLSAPSLCRQSPSSPGSRPPLSLSHHLLLGSLLLWSQGCLGARVRNASHALRHLPLWLPCPPHALHAALLVLPSLRPTLSPPSQSGIVPLCSVRFCVPNTWLSALHSIGNWINIGQMKWMNLEPKKKTRAGKKWKTSGQMSKMVFLWPVGLERNTSFFL